MASPVSASVKRLTLVACILGSGVAFLDGTVVNVALPTIQRELGGGLAAQQWVANAYLLTLGSFILVGGSLGDVYGERRVFAVGVGGFGAISVLCALAPSIGVLVALRAVQGLAGALLVPSSLAVIVATFSVGERGPAIGTWTAWAGIFGVLGPLVGGGLLNVTSWRAVFLINVPLVIATLVLVLSAMPQRPRVPGERHLDWVGAMLCALGLGGAVFALIEQPRLGWGSPAVVWSLVGGIALFVLFLVREARTRDPMLPLGLFRGRNFAAGNVETLSMYAGLSILFFFLTLFLQQVGGYSPLKSGLATLPTTLVLFALSRRFGTLADRYGPRFFMGVGPLIAAGGLALFLRVGVPVDYWGTVLPALLVFSLGLSMTVAPLTAAVLAGVRVDQAGIGSAVNNAIARVAGLVGTAAVGALIAARYASAIDHALAGVPLGPSGRASVAAAKQLTIGVPSVHAVRPSVGLSIRHAATQASLDSFHFGLAISAALVALGGIVGIVWIRNPERAVEAARCEAGQLVAAPADAAGCHEPLSEAPAPGAA